MAKNTPAAKPASAAAPAAGTADAGAAGDATTSARVLAAVTLGGVRIPPGGILEGLPVDIAEAHADALDTHPDAVAYARSIEAPVHQYEPEPAPEADPDDDNAQAE